MNIKILHGVYPLRLGTVFLPHVKWSSNIRNKTLLFAQLSMNMWHFTGLTTCAHNTGRENLNNG